MNNCNSYLEPALQSPATESQPSVINSSLRGIDLDSEARLLFLQWRAERQACGYERAGAGFAVGSLGVMLSIREILRFAQNDKDEKDVSGRLKPAT